jgi:transposase-like protein
MPFTPSASTVARPTHCPQCKGKKIDTIAKVISVDTCWRCRECEATWTIASLALDAARRRDRPSILK